MNGKRDVIMIIASIICIVVTAVLTIQSRNGEELSVTNIEIKTESVIVQPATTAVLTEKSTAVTETRPVYVTESAAEHTYININTADSETLQKLDGIGTAAAEEIIRYRNENGGFRNIEEIMLVTGIGEVTFEKIRLCIYVENPVYPSSEPETEPETVTDTEPESEPETEHSLTLEEISPLDINTATVEELVLLPHVNEEIAADIIKLRNDLNGYSSIYELLFIEKLEQKQVAEMAEFVIVGQ